MNTNLQNLSTEIIRIFEEERRERKVKRRKVINVNRINKRSVRKRINDPWNRGNDQF
jgi:hypothetical protein